ncbi:MAG: ATP-binding protein, partial [Parachlamydiaceae bacterium]
MRKFAELHKKHLLEFNFEKNLTLASLFSSNEPHQILLNLSAQFDVEIDLNNTILFLDEIQAVPEILAKLRWFAEDMPRLPVIAAGSLLEFVLEDHTFSMPVGRIGYMYMEPFSFEEFLTASGKPHLVSYLKQFQWDQEIPLAIHENLTGMFKEYIYIGGMPAAVSSWISKRSLQEVSKIQHDLLATYRDDITKYRGRSAPERLEEVLLAVPKLLGEKFVYTKVNPHVQIAPIKKALDLLCKAKVCHRVTGCGGNGIPLGADLLEKYLKVLLLDVGLCTTALGLSYEQIHMTDEIVLINKGGVAEQAVGQSLRTLFPPYMEPELYYWHREEKGSSAEVDYLIQHHNEVVPIKVKAGATGTLKSLHLFMGA